MTPQANQRMFRGVIVPLVTPLSAQDRLDEAGLDRLVAHVIEGGVNGIFVLGTTGEAPSLSYRIRRELISRVCEAAAEKVPVLVGITDTAFVESVELANYAAEAGATAAVLATPYYFPTGQTELLSYVTEIVEQIPLPVMLYNMPSMTKIWFEVKTLLELSALESIVGVKDSSGDLNYFEQLIRLHEHRPDWSLLVGPEHLLAESVRMGGDGGVMGGANLFPRLFTDCYQAASNNHLKQVEELSLEIEMLQNIYSIGKYASRFIKATKCGLSLLGICDDMMAEPFHHFLPPERKRVQEVLMAMRSDANSLATPSSSLASVQGGSRPQSTAKRDTRQRSQGARSSGSKSQEANPMQYLPAEQTQLEIEGSATEGEAMGHASVIKDRKNPHVLLAMAIGQQAYFEGVGRFAREHGWHLVSDMVYSGKIPRNWRGDGIISFIGHHPSMLDFVLEAKSRGTPVVELSLVRADVDLPRVAADNQMIGRLAAEHLLARGYKHFAWVPFTDDQVNEERYQGFYAGLGQQPCTRLDPAHSWSDGSDWEDDWLSRRQNLISQLLQLPRPLAVFAYNDALAANVISACEVAKIRVSEEIAVLGVDDDPFIQSSCPLPLSSVIHDLEGMAYAGAELLEKLMQGDADNNEVLRIPPKGIVTRKSTDMLAVDDINVAKALSYIAEQYSRPIAVREIVNSTSLTRRQLEKAFRESLNTTINYHLNMVRLNEAKRLLSESSLHVVEIAKLTGYTRANHLFRTFRKHLGMSPLDYRRDQQQLNLAEEQPRQDTLAN